MNTFDLSPLDDAMRKVQQFLDELCEKGLAYRDGDGCIVLSEAAQMLGLNPFSSIPMHVESHTHHYYGPTNIVQSAETVYMNTSAGAHIPAHRYVSTTPAENDYAGVIEWLADEKAAGRDWYELNERNRSKMCREISGLVGWIVDQNSLQKAQNRQMK